MADIVEKYRRAEMSLPRSNRVWEMYGAGLENFGKDGAPVEHEVRDPQPDELLVRMDAVGICFSDVKLITLGPEHPRITGRDLVEDPAIPGHEVSITVVKVGGNLKGRFHPGQRFIVQADVFYGGVSMAYGYVLPGAMQQYGIIGPEVLQGDEGTYLLPIAEETGYLQAALVEPWACVVAAYRIEQRRTLKRDGYAWFYNTGNYDTDILELADGYGLESCPGHTVVTNVAGEFLSKLVAACTAQSVTFTKQDGVRPASFEQLSQEITGGRGFDDIIVLGTPTSEEARELAKVLGKGGLLNIIARDPIGEDVEADIGRVHYDNISFVGCEGPDITLSYQSGRETELLPGGAAWFIGAAGPMGQMHVQRAVELEQPPARILCTDIDDARIDMLRRRVCRAAAEKGIDIRFENPNSLPVGALEDIVQEFTDGAGFDDIVSLVPVAPLISHASHHLADYGLMNIFAGVPRGTKAMLPLSECYRRQVRFIGSSGSKLSDLADTLRLSEEDRLKTANSAAAIGGLGAMKEGVAAVKEGRFPGKTVIFPQFDFPLTALTDLKDELPTVHGKLRDGMFWTKEAEEELFRVMLKDDPSAAAPSQGTPEAAPARARRLEGKAALVTGAAQGLGEALAERLAQEGARVALADLDLEGAKAAASRIGESSGSETMALEADVTDEQQVARALEEAVAKFGKLDIVVSNAGILIAGAIEEFEVEKWRKVIDVNLVGYMIVARAAARAMIPNKSGVIIQINSKSGKKGSFRNSAYAASKFGGVGLTQSLALELAPHNIRVNSVCPGNLLDSPLWVESLYDQYSQTQGLTRQEVRRKYEGQVPLGRGCSYNDVANVVVFLASDESSYMTGQAINVTGGQQMD